LHPCKGSKKEYQQGERWAISCWYTISVRKGLIAHRRASNWLGSLHFLDFVKSSLAHVSGRSVAMGPTANRTCINTTGWKKPMYTWIYFLRAPEPQSASQPQEGRRSHKGASASTSANATKGVKPEAVMAAKGLRGKKNRNKSQKDIIHQKLPRI
jgi:hypothetical protein